MKAGTAQHSATATQTQGIAQHTARTSACERDDKTYELPSNADSYKLGYGVSSIAAMPSPSAKMVSVNRCNKKKKEQPRQSAQQCKRSSKHKHKP